MAHCSILIHLEAAAPLAPLFSYGLHDGSNLMNFTLSLVPLFSF